uniref:ANF_receptor domain-containing protein n=1 Tax=Macrostomum lignano TaxID=282301 RepID=A0A1I8IT70_9PLAT
NDAKTAFLIIGLITYFIGLAFTFACTFLDIFEGNNIVLLVDAGCMILADKLGWSLLCALISGAFLILTVFTGGRGGRGSGGTKQQPASAAAVAPSKLDSRYQWTGAPDWRTEGGYYGPQQPEASYVRTEESHVRTEASCQNRGVMSEPRRHVRTEASCQNRGVMSEPRRHMSEPRRHVRTEASYVRTESNRVICQNRGTITEASCQNQGNMSEPRHNVRTEASCQNQGNMSEPRHSVRTEASCQNRGVMSAAEASRNMSVFWRMLDLCLLLAALSAVPGPAHGMDFRLGVLLEDGSSVSADLINKTVSRIVNDDWMYFSAGSNRRMVLEIAAVPAGKTVQAVQKVCTWHNVSALLAVGSCELAVCARDLGKSLGVPTVVVPVGLCDVAIDSNFVAVGREPISHQVAAAVAAIGYEKVTEIALVYDETQAGSARLVAAMLTKERLREVLLAANATGAIRVDYQWLALDPGVNAAQLLSWLPTAGFPVNLLIIRSPTWGLATTPDTCIDQLTAVVPGCRGDSLTVAQLQAADSVLAVATALLSLNASDSASESRVTCGLPGSWPGGAAVARALKS